MVDPISLGFGVLVLITILLLIYLIYIVLTFIDVIRRKNWIWLAILIIAFFAHVSFLIISIIYHLTKKKKRK